MRLVFARRGSLMRAIQIVALAFSVRPQGANGPSSCCGPARAACASRLSKRPESRWRHGCFAPGGALRVRERPHVPALRPLSRKRGVLRALFLSFARIPIMHSQAHARVLGLADAAKRRSRRRQRSTGFEANAPQAGRLSLSERGVRFSSPIGYDFGPFWNASICGFCGGRARGARERMGVEVYFRSKSS